jgi:membrane associated rhomboid family serine protease
LKELLPGYAGFIKGTINQCCLKPAYYHLCSCLDLAPAGRREDYRRRDEWGNPTTPKSNWRNRIPSALPVSLTGIILAICIIIFFLSLVASYFVIEYLSLIPAFLFDRPWTIVTYMFVHLTFDHLFWNMLFLFFFGMALEQRVGERMFLVIYLLSGIVAAVGQILALSGMDSFIPMVGASGALFGVLGCLAIIAPEIRVLLFFVIPLSIKWAVVLYALVDFASLGSADNIAHMAHITGLLVGLAFGYALRKKPRYYNI